MSKLEGVVAAAMLPQFLAVDPDRGFPVHGAEVEQHLLAFPGVGDLERAAVPKPLILADAFHDARQGGFDRVRDEDLTIPGAGLRCGLFEDRIVPQTVEIEPIRALTIWGRGYSGRGFWGDTSLAQRVIRGPRAGSQSEACGAIRPDTDTSPSRHPTLASFIMAEILATEGAFVERECDTARSCPVPDPQRTVRAPRRGTRPPT